MLTVTFKITGGISSYHMYATARDSKHPFPAKSSLWVIIFVTNFFPLFWENVKLQCFASLSRSVSRFPPELVIHSTPAVRGRY